MRSETRSRITALLRAGLATLAALAAGYAFLHRTTITSPIGDPDRTIKAYEFNEAKASNRLILREGGIHDMADAIKPGEHDASECAT